MIKSVKIVDIENLPVYHTKQVKALKRRVGKEIKFKEGLNVLLAPNGTGKSTLIENIAKYFLCYDTCILEISNRALSYISRRNFNTCMREVKNGMEISTDGNVCYISPQAYNGNIGMDYGVEALSQMIADKESSSGEVNIRSFDIAIKKINRLDFNERRVIVTSNWREVMFDSKEESDDMFKLIEHPDLEPGKPTILIDELDSNMDIVNSITMLAILQDLSKRFQIIVATHNPLILKMKDVNFIELKRGYKKKCLEMMKALEEGSVLRVIVRGNTNEQEK